MSFIHEDFLLTTKTARRLYRQFAEDQPILDYHCHLSPKDVAENRRFQNLFEIWLEGDHYKWRAMRANGVPESHCTGGAGPYEKYLAWARTVPATLRNPLSSDLKAITISGAPCGPTACRKATAPAALGRTRNTSPGRAPSRPRCAIRCIPI